MFDFDQPWKAHLPRSFGSSHRAANLVPYIVRLTPYNWCTLQDRLDGHELFADRFRPCLDLVETVFIIWFDDGRD